MKQIFLTAFLSICPLLAGAQVLSGADPDSVLEEWLETGEWQAVSLHPDIAMDWLSDVDSSLVKIPDNAMFKTHLVTVSVPVGAAVFDWVSDSGEIVAPVSGKYRIRIGEQRRWEFRLQTNLNAGDTGFALPVNGMPEPVSTGFIIRPGQIFREVLIGDFQVNSGFGAVTGSSPVFSVLLGNPGSLHRPGKGFRLHSGTADGRFFRGLAAVIGNGKSEFFLYGSGRDRINEEVTGLAFKRSFTNSEMGFTGIRVINQYPPAIREGWTAVWQPDSGRYGRMGIWAQTRVPFGIVFGEAGWGTARNFGWIAGFRLFETHGFSAVVRYSGRSPGYPVT